MPDPPSDPGGPHPKASLPARRPDGDKPRAFAEQAAEPIGLPDGAGRLQPAPPEIVARRGKASLPTERNKERALPTLTPAPYQAEPTPGHGQAVRAELPGRRGPDELPKFRPPATPNDDAPAAGLPAAAAPAPSAPAPRPAKHRLAANRVLELKRQDTIEADPEVTEAWGGGGQDAVTDHRRSRRVIAWAALIGAPLAAFAVWQSLGRPGSSPPAPTTRVVSTSTSADPAEESRQASEVVQQFLAASTIEERAAFVRHPAITKPRMEAWHSAANPLKPLAVLEFNDRSAEQTIDGVAFIMLSMETDDRYQRAVALEKLPDGKFLVDWESFVSWSDPRWPEFLSKEPGGAHDFRVEVSIDNYFNFAYQDPKQWFCFKLIDPEGWAHCWGYCTIDSEAGLKINRMIRRQRQQGEDVIKAILRLKFEAAGKGRNQVLIEDVIQDGWLRATP